MYQGTLHKKGSKDCKSQKIRKWAVKCHLLARHRHCNHELIAAVDPYTRSTKEEKGVDRRGTHEPYKTTESHVPGKGTS